MKIRRSRTQPSSSHPDRLYSGKRRMKTDLSLSLLFAQESVSMCKNSSLPPNLLHTNIPLKHSHTHAHHSFKGSLLGSLVSLGRVKGFVCFSVCGQDVASTSR